MEGGKYVLAMFSELVLGLLEEGNISGAASVVRKLYGAAEVPFEQIVSDATNTATWLFLFSEVLDNTLEEGIF